MEENVTTKRWKRPRKVLGLGDLVEVIAKPLAHAIDAVVNSNLRNCGGCKARRDKLNELVPFEDTGTLP